MKLTIQVLKLALVPNSVTDHYDVQGMAETRWGTAPPMLPNVLPAVKGLTRLDWEE